MTLVALWVHQSTWLLLKFSLHLAPPLNIRQFDLVRLGHARTQPLGIGMDNIQDVYFIEKTSLVSLTLGLSS